MKRYIYVNKMDNGSIDVPEQFATDLETATEKMEEHKTRWLHGFPALREDHERFVVIAVEIPE